ncbi:metal-dependent hydrolase [Vermiphilus pyriformis]|jgi:membrane-bound metal-dependent hydrolase YbcI (DUF457 family)|nr:MAG: metal-dependent hydrolase [Vermiphilus pyriformis]
MPGYRTHLIGGVCAYALVSILVVPLVKPTALTMIEWFAVALAGSLFPDIDIKSKGQKIFYILICAALILLSYQKQYIFMAYLSIASCVPLMVKHRGIFHSMWFLIAGAVAVVSTGYYYCPDYQYILASNMCFFIAGAISHLWLDMGFRRMVGF